MAFFIALLINSIINLQVINSFHANEKQVALTFDACETKTPSYFDKEVLEFVIREEIPVTIFLSGKFIERNTKDVKEVAKYEFIEIENHSYSHHDFTKLSDSDAKEDILKNERLIESVVGKKPVYFRFPYGYYNQTKLKILEDLGYKVVHWTFPSGDPDKTITKEMLIENTLRKVKPGSILIFHINGRGWKTKEALPEIVTKLREWGYSFVLLKEVIK
ncbi:MAG: polysaccharide deacetylase family protein [Proteobacteria bacterium]|nr:polysaccharide deacetylase family protein [Pseudomonadota bacterium]